MALHQQLQHPMWDATTRSSPRSHTTLFDLPAELRNEIYTHLLVSHNELYLAHDTSRNQPENHCDPHMAVNHDRHMAGKRSSSGLTPAILSTCKQLYLEAAPILYGTNHFRFGSIFCIESFIKRIRTNIGRIKHVHLDYMPSSDTVTTLSGLLCAAKDLKTLSWTWLPTMMAKDFSAEKFANALMGLVQVLVEQRNVEDVLRMLKCREPDFLWCVVPGHERGKCGCEKRRARRYYENVGSVLRRKLAGSSER